MITCSVTGQSQDTTRLPRGWKRWNGCIYSGEAWKQKYILRTFYLPILKPIDTDWKTLSQMLHESWSLATNATKWAYKELLKHDITRSPEMTKIPKMPAIYLYGNGKWDGWSQTAQCTLRLCEQQYRKKRYDIIWRGNASLPNSRYPQPWLLHNASYDISDTGENLILSARLAGERVQMVLKTHRHKRATKIIRRVASGELMKTEGKIYKGKQGDVMFACGVWIPRSASGEQTGTLYVRTDSESFIVALNAKDEKLWVINGDNCRQVLVKRDRAQQRFRDDLKFERRPMTKIEKQNQESIQLKQQNRIRDFIRNSSSQIANYASRRKFSKIQFDGTCKEYFRKFPWFEFESQLKHKCDELGLEFTLASTEADA